MLANCPKEGGTKEEEDIDMRGTKRFSGRNFHWLLGAICLLVAGVMPQAAHAYWACVTTCEGCVTESICSEYYDSNDQWTGGTRVERHRNLNCES